MKPEANGTLQRGAGEKKLNVDRTNWVFIVGGALLSTLTIRVGWRLRQIFNGKKSSNTRDKLAGNGKPGAKNKAGAKTRHTDIDSEQNRNNCYTTSGCVEMKRASSGPVMEEEPSLPLVMIPAVVSSIESTGEPWRSSPDPQRPFQHSNSSDSLKISESTSDIFTKRDVIQKLRQQLKRRDEMIMEMQAQLKDLQNSLNMQISQTAQLQSQLDSANKELFDSDREIQRLRMVVTEHVAEMTSPEKPASAPGWYPRANGHSNGYLDSVNALDLHGVEKGVRDGERIEMLKREVQELKEVIEGKEFLLKSYKEQKTELTSKVKELQQRVNYQMPNIL